MYELRFLVSALVTFNISRLILNYWKQPMLLKRFVTTLPASAVYTAGRPTVYWTRDVAPQLLFFFEKPLMPLEVCQSWWFLSFPLCFLRQYHSAWCNLTRKRVTIDNYKEWLFLVVHRWICFYSTKLVYTCNHFSTQTCYTHKCKIQTHSAPLHSYHFRFNNQQLFGSSNVGVNNSLSNVISHSFHSLSSTSGVCKRVHMYVCVSLLARTHNHVGTCVYGCSCTVGAVAGFACV